MARNNVIVIGASAGGVEVLKTLVSGFPNDFPAAVFVVLHIRIRLKQSMLFWSG